MTPQEASTLLTYANQIDARVQLTESNAEVWAYALRNVDYAKARWCIREHYASHVDGGPPSSLAPGMIRARVGELSRAAEGRRTAIAKTQEVKALESVGDVLRSDPDEKPGASRFQQLMEQYQANMKNV